MLLSLLTVVASSVRPPHSPSHFTRRAALLGGASAAFLKPAAPVCAEDEDVIEGVLEGIMARAQRGELTVSRVIERAKSNELVEISTDSFSCKVLDSLVRVDQGACDSAQATIKTLRGAQSRRSDDPAEMERQAQAKVELAELQTIKTRIDKQVSRLVSLEEEKGCVDAVATYDRARILERASKGRLTTDRVIQRARSNQLVSVEDAFDAKLGCKSLDALRKVDRKALTELQRARTTSAESEWADEMVATEQNLRSQLSKVDTRFATFCETMDFTAGVM